MSESPFETKEVHRANSATGIMTPTQLMGTAELEPLDRAAFHGLAGQIIRKIEPHTEADPAAMLVQLLVAFGNCVGRKPHFLVEDTPH